MDDKRKQIFDYNPSDEFVNAFNKWILLFV